MIKLKYTYSSLTFIKTFLNYIVNKIAFIINKNYILYDLGLNENNISEEVFY
tara:strand:- start:2138 stop:2293 length:156 start_codon:yes stop_codon:yes gene_type:complete